ncbi:MAG: TIGR00375 family protein [Euryarchaeota archaeon]|nr:TIGR00375 family protein [Euryarchaeota archaeon]
MLYNADLHIHSKHSMGTSGAMDMETLARESPRKGISLLGTGDCLHPEWLREIRESCEESDGIFSMGKVHFLLQTEVEDNHRVHHIIFFPEFSSVEGFIEALKGRHSPLSSDGRPKMHMGGAEIAQAALDNGAMIGPSHAFTPWTGMYAHHDSLASCYGDQAGKVHFAELGLSADSDYADRIPEMRRLAFLTNSDAHSPYPTRIAREFNRIEMKAPSFAELRKAILHEGGRKFVLNVGLPPQEGKYNESACIKCLTHYALDQAKALRWRCRCGGVIKKGVRDRVEELSDSREPKHPAHRPPYLHLIPLGEIITKALGVANPNSKEVDEAWSAIVGKFGSEVAALVDAPINEIQPKEVAEAIAMFREGRVRLIPGGGGQYGQVVLGDEKIEPPKAPAPKGQRGLFDFR